MDLGGPVWQEERLVGLLLQKCRHLIGQKSLRLFRTGSVYRGEKRINLVPETKEA